MNFESAFIKFVEDTIRSVPEYEDVGIRILEDIRIRKYIDTYRRYFINSVKNHTERITNQDDTLFTEDDMILIRGFSLKNYWNQFSDSTKKTVWQYIQYLLLCVKYENTQQMKNDNENDNENINVNENVNENVNLNGNTPEKDENNPSNNTFDGFENFFNDQMNPDMIKKMVENLKKNQPSIEQGEDMMKGIMNTKIGGLAKEIAEGLGVEQLAADLGIKEEDKNNPMEVIKKFTTGSGAKKMMGVMSKITNTLQQKMQSGELNPKDLVQEAMGMMDNISGMKKHPLMKGLQSMLQKESNKVTNNQRLQRLLQSRQQAQQQQQQAQQEQHRETQALNEEAELDRILNYVQNNINENMNENNNGNKKKTRRGKRGGRNKSKK